MRRHLVAGIGISLLLPFTQHVAAQPTDTVESAGDTLLSLWQQAEQHYPRLRQDRALKEAAESRLKEATYAPFFQWRAIAGFTLTPSVTGTSSYSLDGQLPLSNQWGPAFSWRVEGAVPLYTFGKLMRLRDAAQAGVRAADAQQAVTRDWLRLQVARAYFAVSGASELEYILKEADGYVAAAEKQVASKEAADPIQTQQLEMAKAELLLLRSEVIKLRRSGVEALQLLTGKKRVALIDCPLQPVVEHVEAAANGARPEEIQLQAAQAAKAAEADIERGRLLPDLALVFAAGGTHTPGVTDQDNVFAADPANAPTLGAAIVLRWTLDWIGGWFRLKRVQAEARALDAQIDEARAAISLEARVAQEETADLERKRTAYSARARAARAVMIAQLQAFQIGTLELDKLIETLKTYLESRAGLAQTVAAYNVAVVELERASGTHQITDATWRAMCTEED